METQKKTQTIGGLNEHCAIMLTFQLWREFVDNRVLAVVGFISAVKISSVSGGRLPVNLLWRDVDPFIIRVIVFCESLAAIRAGRCVSSDRKFRLFRQL